MIVVGRPFSSFLKPVHFTTYVVSTKSNRKSNGFARGRQFGPFLTLEDAKDWFERYTPVVGLGDYFWVINDTAEAGGTEVTTNSSSYTLQNIIADYGTVSGTVSGTAKQAKLTVPVTGTVTGHMDDAEETAVEGEVAGTGTGTPDFSDDDVVDADYKEI